ncbi:protein ERGIC-53-like [Amphiura filiformis]|uniref:protein ERGIC-53-like n=1 Tax=Amphiura filiformis TaxID=82378 RepID=UPI003B221761
MATFSQCAFFASLAIFFVVAWADVTKPLRKFEYKYSFKGPHLIQKDGSVPFWQFAGSALAGDDQVRITPSLRSRKGEIWGRYPVDFDHWEVELIFKVTGRGRIGADGLAFWYTNPKGTEGPVFGNKDYWNGLGIFFDSFDNDNQRNNPYIMVMTNDGTKKYEHYNDGLTQQLGGCLRDFRNKPYPVRAKIEYFQNTLTVFFHNGWTNSEFDYELCMRQENVVLPKNGYFGVTAATGGLADDHDALKLLTHSLRPQQADQVKDGFISEEERLKFTQEYDEYYKKLQQQKEEFREKHPDKVKDQFEEEKFFEDTQTRELRLIFDAQSSIIQNVKALSRKLDEIVGRQERTLSAISAVQSGQGNYQQQPPPGSGQQQQIPAATSPIQRHEVDTILNTQQELQRSIRDVRNLVGDVHTKTGVIYNKQSQGGGQQGFGGGGGGDVLSHEMRDTLKTLRSDMSNLINRPESKSAPCPPMPDYPACLSTTYFLLFVILQVGLFFVYVGYRSKQDAAAKKFY